MNIDAYKVQFASYKEDALRLKATNKEDYQAKIAALSSQAAYFYYAHSNYKEKDYRAKIDIFLEFDRYLKTLKREFNTSNKNTFFAGQNRPVEQLIYDNPDFLPR